MGLKEKISYCYFLLYHFGMLPNLTKTISRSFSQFVKLTRMEGKYNAVAQLELDNPKKKNALSMALLD